MKKASCSSVLIRRGLSHKDQRDARSLPHAERFVSWQLPVHEHLTQRTLLCLYESVIPVVPCRNRSVDRLKTNVSFVLRHKRVIACNSFECQCKDRERTGSKPPFIPVFHSYSLFGITTQGIALTSFSILRIIKPDAPGVRDSVSIFPTFHKMEPGSKVLLCQASSVRCRGRQMQSAGYQPALQSG